MAIPSWVTINPLTGSGNKTVSITAQKNTGTVDRTFQLKVVTAGGITKIINIAQVAAQGYEWIKEPVWKRNFNNEGFAYQSTQAQIKNLPENYNVEAVEALVFSANGEEVSSAPTITRFSGEDLGMEIGMSIDSYDDVNKIATVTFSITITNYNTLLNWFDYKYNGSGSGEDPYYGTLDIYIGLGGIEGDTTNEVSLNIYEPALASEITLNPESADLALEDSVEFKANYIDMLGGTITFEPGVEMQNSDGAVYMDNWTGDTSSDPLNKNNNGTIKFYINANSEATAGTYRFEVTGKNNKGETYSAPGEVYIS